MNRTPLNLSYRRSALFLFFTAFLVPTFSVGFAQVVSDPSVIVAKKSDGFVATITVESTRYTLEAQQESPTSWVCSIVDNSGKLLMSSHRNGKSLVVSFAKVSVVFDLESKLPLSESDRAHVSSFAASTDARIVRSLISNLFRNRTDDIQPYLTGFSIMAMVVGDGPGAQSLKRNSLQKDSFFGVEAVELARVNFCVAPDRNSKDDECLGCCGPACWGCTGCYTVACLAHDVCVGVYGATHPQCMALLVVAIASMAECNQS